MNSKFIIFLSMNLIVFNCAFGQVKRDYQWIMGYDTSLLDVNGSAIQLNFNNCEINLSNVYTVSNFHMEGSNTSMSDTNGGLLFYSNGCYIINKAGEIMENGDGINPGLIEDIYCPAGGSPYIQGVISIPAPGSDSLYYVFNLDMQQPYFMVGNFIGIAPERLYYQVVDMTQSGGLGKVILKNQVAVQDTFARGSMKAVRHANGVDWWLIVPKSHSNCYFLTLITAQGVQPAVLECEGKVWNDFDLSAQTVFSPDGNKYIRCNKDNGLNIFDFDSETGNLSNPLVIDFPNDTFYHGGVSVSANSRFLYLSARKKLYQFDLQADDISASQILIGEWDGFSDPYPTIFYISALAPDNKIYISSTSSHRFLHVIYEPDSLGLACNLEQRGLSLPSYNFATIPNFPHYRMSNEECDTTSNTIETELAGHSITLYPNPTKGELWINFSDIGNQSADLKIFDFLGRIVYQEKIVQPLSRMNLSGLRPGNYIYSVQQPGAVSSGKIVKIE